MPSSRIHQPRTDSTMLLLLAALVPVKTCREQTFVHCGDLLAVLEQSLPDQTQHQGPATTICSRDAPRPVPWKCTLRAAHNAHLARDTAQPEVQLTFTACSLLPHTCTRVTPTLRENPQRGAWGVPFMNSITGSCEHARQVACTRSGHTWSLVIVFQLSEALAVVQGPHQA
jgi:hypothetical protein